MNVKGHCPHRVHVRVLIDTILLTNRIRNSTDAADEFAVGQLNRVFSPFAFKENLSCLCCGKAVSVEYKPIYLTFFLPCSSSRYFLRTFFRIRLLRGEKGFVSSRIENPFSRTSNFSTQNKKYAFKIFHK